ncbi:MAG: hypothetical protein MZV70_07365 [Desulfobacterales bacterium]|nr:hypothetical protein [Desulfobacterales bacterium]
MSEIEACLQGCRGSVGRCQSRRVVPVLEARTGRRATARRRPAGQRHERKAPLQGYAGIR